MELKIELELFLSPVDVFYTLRLDPATHLPFFKGYHKTIINYDETTEAWTLSSEDDSVNGRSPGPIGIAMGTNIMEWTFETPICSSPAHNGKMILTVCSPRQFTCHTDGEMKSYIKRPPWSVCSGS